VPRLPLAAPDRAYARRSGIGLAISMPNSAEIRFFMRLLNSGDTANGEFDQKRRTLRSTLQLEI
jgi:hypothetical protein